MAISLREFPAKFRENIIENNGRDPSKWNQELRDLFDTSIEAKLVSAPQSGKIEKFFNTDYHYYWAFDRAERHERVEELIYAGWEFATTNDVKMCTESSVHARRKGKDTRDGGEGFSDEIRSGDRRLLKIPMTLWRPHKKAQLMASYQQSYPQAFGNTGQPMDAANLIPGFKSEMMDPAAIDETRRRANPSNSVQAKER